MKRWFFFIITNLLVSITLMILANIVMAYMGVQAGSYSGLFVFAFFLGLGGSFFSLMISKFIAKRFMNLEPAAPGSALVQRVHALARKSGLDEMPEVFLFQSPEVNAFATGPSRNNALVAVSTGLLNRMDDDEVEAVLAHEVSHIANGDMVTMALVQGIVNTFVIFISYVVSQIVMNAMRGDDDDSRGIGDWFLYNIIHNIIYTLFSFLSLPLVMYVSRWREYRADYGAGQLVGKEKMIRALEKLKSSTDTLESHDKSVEVMAISAKSSFAEIFSSHPPLEKRIAALR